MLILGISGRPRLRPPGLLLLINGHSDEVRPENARYTPAYYR
jgi:hypothetical protein